MAGRTEDADEPIAPSSDLGESSSSFLGFEEVEFCPPTRIFHFLT